MKDCLLKFGFKLSKFEPCLLTLFCENVKIIVAVYVDDFLIFSNNTSETEKLKNVLRSEFKLKDLGSVRRYLGMRINVNKECKVITLDQPEYMY